MSSVESSQTHSPRPKPRRNAVELGFRHDDHADQGVAVRKAGCVWW
jgi:hypothetical protein